MSEDEKRRQCALDRACAVLELSIKNFKASVHNAVAGTQHGQEAHYRRTGSA